MKKLLWIVAVMVVSLSVWAQTTTRQFGSLNTNNTWTGKQTFSVSPAVPSPTQANDAASKDYVDNKTWNWSAIANKPTYFQTDWLTTVANKPNFAAVATSGSYTDLSNKPTLPANTTATASQFFTAYNSATGAFTKAQPTWGDIASKPCLPSTKTVTAGQYISGYDASTCTWSTATDQSGSGGAQTNVANTWTALQTFSAGIATTTVEASGSVHGGGNSGDAFVVGDDLKIVDINASNTAGLQGQQNTNIAFLKFGASGPVVGYDGSTFAIPATLNTSGYQVNGSPLSSSHLSDSASLKTRQIVFMIGADNGPVLTDADDQPDFWVNRLGTNVTITEVFCKSDAGTPTININNQASAMLATPLTCSNTSASTTSISNQIVASGSVLSYYTVTAGGTAKRITVVIKYTVG